MDTPKWFDDAIKATLGNYRRIDTSKRVCRICGHYIMTATNRVLRSGDDTPPDQNHPEIYSFCACAQVITSTGLQEPGMWEDMARMYHQKIALPGSEEHQKIMLTGEPTPKLRKLRILGRIEEDT
jgi:hypothetical protein